MMLLRHPPVVAAPARAFSFEQNFPGYFDQCGARKADAGAADVELQSGWRFVCMYVM